jgi:hypothetical protein
VNSNVKVGSDVEKYQEMCVKIMRGVTERVEEKQESHGFHKILPVKWMKEGSGRMSTTTNKCTTTEQ